MLYYSLKTLNELEEVEDRKQQEAKAYAHLTSPSITNPRSAVPKADYLLALSPSFFKR
jgi:Pyruvate/2-oxoacid:ferredoxin oxidoreductase gamma subunit